MANPKAGSRVLGKNALRGRRLSQVFFVAALVWVIVSGTVQVVRDAFATGAQPQSAAVCRVALADLRERLFVANAQVHTGGELAAVRTFRERLGGVAGQEWDAQQLRLVDGCPEAEADVARQLGRLRAATEAMVRLDALTVSRARLAHERALDRVK